MIGAALASPVDKDAVGGELAPTRVLFGRSAVARTGLPAGHLLAREDLTAKKPRGGIPPAGLDALVGMRLRRALAPDEALRDSDVEGFSGLKKHSNNGEIS